MTIVELSLTDILMIRPQCQKIVRRIIMSQESLFLGFTAVELLID